MEIEWISPVNKVGLNTVAREITYAAAQNVREYVWCLKLDQGERNGRLERSNSHPPDRKSCLTPGPPIRVGVHVNYHIVRLTRMWHFGILILSPAWMHGAEGVLSLADAQ